MALSFGQKENSKRMINGALISTKECQNIVDLFGREIVRIKMPIAARNDFFIIIFRDLLFWIVYAYLNSNLFIFAAALVLKVAARDYHSTIPKREREILMRTGYT